MFITIVFILVLAVLIFIHELGHFLVAKWNGIRVDAFALGFGPKIVSMQFGETLYSINLIPFGGYVKIFGENPDEASISGPDKERSFVNKKRWKQASVLVAGVVFNFLFAWLLYTTIFTTGVTVTTDGFEKYTDKFRNGRIVVSQVFPNTPAEAAGLVMGDTIVRINSVIPPPVTTKSKISTPVMATTTTVETLPGPQTVARIQTEINNSNGKPINVVYARGGAVMVSQVIPKSGLIEGRYAIGIAMQDVVDIQLPFFISIYEGGYYTVMMIKETAVGLYQFILTIFQGKANLDSVAGPVGIAGIVGDAAHLGLTYLLMITALISINLGVINLLPFPALDGGRLLFVGIEGIIRRRIPHSFTNIVNTVGFVLLLLLMAIVTYRDIAKLFA